MFCISNKKSVKLSFIVFSSKFDNVLLKVRTLLDLNSYLNPTSFIKVIFSFGSLISAVNPYSIFTKEFL